MMSPVPQRKKKNNNNNGQNIKAFVRVRPMNSSELNSKSHSLVSCPSNKEVVVQERPIDKFTKKFSFDRSFDQKSKQIDVYKAVAKPLVEEVLNGFNCTIFAYGQTGTGKTFTMEGDNFSEGISLDKNEGAGIIPRCVNQIFDELRVQKSVFDMRVSFIELYNEELFDLLSAGEDLSRLRLYEDAMRKGSCNIKGLEETPVKTQTDVYRLIEKGSAKRQTAATMMNAHSSRSHSVFTITVCINESTMDGEEMIRTGKLNLVDLAGSENIGRSGAVDKRAREAGNINQSLLTLGRVITSLVEKAPHIPYRESKLTRLLQDALGGRSKTSIIATVSPASINLEETLSTLDYAHRAKNIQNRPEVNQKLTQKEFFGEMSNEVVRLKRELASQREKDGVFLSTENYDDMVSTKEHQDQEITEKITRIRFLEEETERLKEVFVQLEETEEKLKLTETRLDSTKETLRCTQSLLTQTSNDLDDQKSLVSAHEQTEQKLHNQGNDLIQVASSTTSDLVQLHDKLDRKRKVEIMNEEVENNFSSDMENKFSETETLIETVTEERKEDMKSILGNKDKCFFNVESNLPKILSVHSVGLGNYAEFVTSMIDTEDARIKSLNDITINICNRGTGTLATAREEISHNILNIGNKICSQKETSSLFSTTQCEKYATVNEGCQRAEVQQKTETSKIKCVLKEVLEEDAASLSTVERVSKEIDDACKLYLQKDKDLFDSWMVQEASRKEETQKKLDKIKEEKRKIKDDDKKKSQEQIDSLNLKMKENKEYFENKIQNLKQQIRQHEQSMKSNREGKCKQVSGAVQSIEKCSEDHQTESSSQIMNLVKDIQSFDNEGQSNFDSTHDALKAHCSQSFEMLGLVSEDFETIHKSSIEFNDATTNAHQSYKKENKTMSSSIDATLKKTLNKELLTITTEKNRSNDATENVFRRFDESELYLNEGLFSIRAKTSQLNSDVLELPEKLVKDVPTGMTPLRREYCYPNNLAKTSPHERILDRRRRAIQGGSRIPLPSFGNEDELNPPIGSVQNLSSESENADTSAPGLQRSESFKDSTSLFREPLLPSVQSKESTISSCPLSRSSSTSSLDSKENVNSSRRTKKRELRPPSTTTSYNADKLAAPERETRSTRKVLGSFN